jgi:hypothetical protein
MAVVVKVAAEDIAVVVTAAADKLSAATAPITNA